MDGGHAQTAEYPRRTAPLVILGVGATALVASLPFGTRPAVAGAVAFLAAAGLALWDTRVPVVTWAGAISFLVGLVWLIPIRLYRLPVDVGFHVELYRLVTVVLLGALVVWVLTGHGALSAAGSGRPLVALAAAAVLTQTVNFSSLNETAAGVALKSLSYFLSFILVYVLVASTMTSLDRIETVVRALVIGGAVVAAFAVYEARADTNVFDELNRWIPFLDRQEREILELRGGRLRVHASAQHPIALGVALSLVVPLAAYLASRARSTSRRLLWVALGAVCVLGTAVTISRTTLVVFGVMIVVALLLRARSIVRFWPALLVLPLFIHVAAPGVMGGLYRSLFPRGGLETQLSGRAGLQGSGRLADVGPGLRIWEQSPLVGQGLGAVMVEPTAPSEKSLGQADVAIIFDNEYMTTLTSMGVIGLAVVLWFLGGTLIRLGRAARKLPAPTGDLAAACCVAAAGFVTSMVFFDAFSFVQATLIFFFVTACGLRAAQLARAEAGRPTTGSAA